MQRIFALTPALLAASLSAAASAPDTEAVEFYNSVTNHYFVTATASEGQSLDAGAAGPGWLRTGRSFQAWLDKSAAAPDAQPVCRFYSAGANSHFYTASSSECQQLKGLEAAERARGGTVQGWQYEGIAFYVQAPTNGSCPAGTVALTRAYNDGFTSGEGSNHRFIDDTELQSLMTDRAWAAEGTVMCTQPKSTGTNANLKATTTSFDTLAATWTGDARWKSEDNGVETRDTQALSLSIAADGALGGSGNGCTFTGKVSGGDGFRSLFTGTVNATGCKVASFNGDYQWLHLERFGEGTLMVRMKREAGPVEAMIDARLTTGTTAATPATGASFASVAGDWVGTVGWIAKQVASGKDNVRTAVNKPLDLSISSTGAVTGTGYGCTVTGSLAARPGESGFAGAIATSGCENATFNGAFTDVRVKREDGGRLHVDFERVTPQDGGRLDVDIEGTLQASGGTTPTTPSVPDFVVTGSWDGKVTWFAVTRTTGPALVTMSTERLQLAIADSGAVSGSGFGCTITGQLTLSADKREVKSGSVTASGCAKSEFNGTYTQVEMEREDGRALEVSLRRENEVSGTGTSVRIGGTLTRAS